MNQSNFIVMMGSPLPTTEDFDFQTPSPKGYSESHSYTGAVLVGGPACQKRKNDRRKADVNHKTNCSLFPSAYRYKPFENSMSSGIKILMSE
jgi:hypothetical protein